MEGEAEEKRNKGEGKGNGNKDIGDLKVVSGCEFDALEMLIGDS